MAGLHGGRRKATAGYDQLEDDTAVPMMTDTNRKRRESKDMFGTRQAFISLHKDTWAERRRAERRGVKRQRSHVGELHGFESSTGEASFSVRGSALRLVA